MESARWVHLPLRGFCLHRDRLQEIVGPLLFRVGGGHVECGFVRIPAVAAAHVPDDATQLHEQGAEAVHYGAVVQELRVDFAQGGGGPLGRGHGVPGGLRGLVLIGEQERAPGLEHVPLDVVGQQAEEDVRPHPRLEAVVDRPHLEVHGLERPEGPFHLAEALVAPHRLIGVQARRSARSCGGT